MQHSSGEKRNSLIGRSKRFLLVGAVTGVILIILVLFLLAKPGTSHRTESYKKGTGAAGLQANISYKVRCDKQPCDKKPTYDFNVYLFADSGQQIAVIQPDKNGNVNAALAEGNYVLLIGKRFGKDKVFPQEFIMLKNGKKLELKLQYEEAL